MFCITCATAGLHELTGVNSFTVLSILRLSKRLVRLWDKSIRSRYTPHFGWKYWTKYT